MAFDWAHSLSDKRLKICAWSLIVAGVTSIALALLPKSEAESSAELLAPTAVQDEWLIPIGERVSSLDPQLLIESVEKSLLSFAFSQLLRVNNKFEIEPDVLEKWIPSTETNQFTFKLRTGLTFWDGSPITVDDVEFSIHEWAKKDRLDSDLLLPIVGVEEFRNGRSPTIAGFEKVDPHTFRIRLRSWVDHFILTLASPRFIVFPKGFRGVSREQFFKAPLSSGPFKLVPSHNKGLKFVRNERYHLGSPLIPSIAIEYMEQAEAIRAFNSGQVDNLIMYDIHDLTGIDLANAKVRPLKRYDTFSLIIPPNTPSLKKVEKRRQIAQMVRSLPIHSVCIPGSKKASKFIPRGIVGSTSGIEQLPPKEVSVMQPITGFTVNVTSDALGGCIASLADDKLEGVKVNRLQFSAMFAKLKKSQLEPWLESLTFGGEDPIPVLQYFSSTSPEYFLQAPIPELQKIFDSINDDLPIVEKARRYRQIEDFLLTNYYLVPIAHRQSNMVHRVGLKNLGDIASNRYIPNLHLIYRESQE